MIQRCQNLFLITLKLKKCLETLFQKFWEYCHLFLIATKIKKYMKEAVDYCLHTLEYVPDCYMVQEARQKN